MVSHEQIPGEVKRVLLGHASSFVPMGKRFVFGHKLSVGNADVIDVVNQGREDASKLSQWVAGNPIATFDLYWVSARPNPNDQVHLRMVVQRYRESIRCLRHFD